MKHTPKQLTLVNFTLSDTNVIDILNKIFKDSIVTITIGLDEKHYAKYKKELAKNDYIGAKVTLENIIM